MGHLSETPPNITKKTASLIDSILVVILIFSLFPSFRARRLDVGNNGWWHKRGAPADNGWWWEPLFFSPRWYEGTNMNQQPVEDDISSFKYIYLYINIFIHIYTHALAYLHIAYITWPCPYIHALILSGILLMCSKSFHPVKVYSSDEGKSPCFREIQVGELW